MQLYHHTPPLSSAFLIFSQKIFANHKLPRLKVKRGIKSIFKKILDKSIERLIE